MLLSQRCPLALVGSTVVTWMDREDREVMEARGAGESCPTLSKVAPADSMPEGKLKASLVRGASGDLPWPFCGGWESGAISLRVYKHVLGDLLAKKNSDPPCNCPQLPRNQRLLTGL